MLQVVKKKAVMSGKDGAGEAGKGGERDDRERESKRKEDGGHQQSAAAGGSSHGSGGGNIIPAERKTTASGDDHNSPQSTQDAAPDDSNEETPIRRTSRKSEIVRKLKAESARERERTKPALLTEEQRQQSREHLERESRRARQRSAERHRAEPSRRYEEEKALKLEKIRKEKYEEQLGELEKKEEEEKREAEKKEEEKAQKIFERLEVGRLREAQEQARQEHLRRKAAREEDERRREAMRADLERNYEVDESQVGRQRATGAISRRQVARQRAPKGKFVDLKEEDFELVPRGAQKEAEAKKFKAKQKVKFVKDVGVKRYPSEGDENSQPGRRRRLTPEEMYYAQVRTRRFNIMAKYIEKLDRMERGHGFNAWLPKPGDELLLEKLWKKTEERLRCGGYLEEEDGEE